MKMIEIAALDNGAHNNQTFNGILPNGWAIIPEELEPLANFPFGEVTAEEVIHYREKQVEQEVIKPREVITYDEDGNETVTTEEYTELETVTVQEPYGVMTVVKWIPGVLPEPEPTPDPGPSEADDTAGMLVDHEYRLTLLELGLTEF